MKIHYEWNNDKLRRAWGSELEDLTPPMREAALFRLTVERYPIWIDDNDIIAGWYGFGTKSELESYYVVDPPKPASPPSEPRPKTPVEVLRDYGFKPGGYDKGHYEMDYRAIISRGINAYIADVETELALPDNTAQKIDYLNGMRSALSNAEIFASRYADLAEARAAEATDEAAKARFLRIAKACRKVPMQPAEDFFEAVQAAYLVWSLCCISYTNWTSISFGSFDQYMYPYYKASVEQGMTEEEAIAILLQFFKMLDHYNAIDCVISVGGVDNDGNDATNELSYVLIKAEKRSKLRSPLFVARINKNTPKTLMRELVSKELFEMGQPSFYSEEQCLAAVLRRGVEPEIAKTYQISTCMVMAIADREVSHGWGCIVNTHFPLELAINGGKPLHGELPFELKTKPLKEYKNIDEIYLQYTSYLREVFKICMDWTDETIKNAARRFPNPFVSAFTGNCIERGLDRWDGGAVYHNLAIETMAFANAADSITAIDKLVFKEGKYTLEHFVNAARANYDGYEAFRKELLSCPKYGMNNSKADTNVCRLLDINAEICEENRKDNRRYLPSLHTLWEDVNWGGRRYASFDGRLDGEPVNKNAGPTTLMRSSGPTNIVLSAAKIDQHRYNGGQALDVHIGVRNMDSDTNRDKIAAFIRTYFNLGGLQIQVNGLTSEVLQKAYDNPEQYPNLIVRIGGHSRYFNTFSDNMKREFIKRFQIEEGAFAL